MIKHTISKTLFIASSVLASLVVAPAATVGIYGGDSFGAANFLNTQGFTATALDTFASDYTGFDSIVLLRVAPGGAESQSLIDFVHAGGKLITEWDASDWALNVAGLLNVSDNGGGYVGTSTPVTFTAEGLAAGLGNGLGTTYSFNGATEFFRDFGTPGDGVTVLATRPDNVAAIVAGVSGAGQVFAIGYDWGDEGFGSNPSGTLLVNALNANVSNTPEPAFGFGVGFALVGIGLVRRFRPISR